MNETQFDVDLEALFDEEIPCSGIGAPAVRRDCDRPAALVFVGHGDGRRCESTPPFKCLACYQILIGYLARSFAELECVECEKCGGHFCSLDDFVQYRPL